MRARRQCNMARKSRTAGPGVAKQSSLLDVEEILQPDNAMQTELQQQTASTIGALARQCEPPAPSDAQDPASGQCLQLMLGVQLYCRRQCSHRSFCATALQCDAQAAAMQRKWQGLAWGIAECILARVSLRCNASRLAVQCPSGIAQARKNMIAGGPLASIKKSMCNAVCISKAEAMRCGLGVAVRC